MVGNCIYTGSQGQGYTHPIIYIFTQKIYIRSRGVASFGTALPPLRSRFAPEGNKVRSRREQSALLHIHTVLVYNKLFAVLLLFITSFYTCLSIFYILNISVQFEMYLYLQTIRLIQVQQQLYQNTYDLAKDYLYPNPRSGIIPDLPHW